MSTETIRLVIPTGREKVRANDTNYGLSGAVFTRDFARAHRVANQIEAGNVWINSYNDLPPSIPFGGYKQSGNGREWGEHGFEEFLEVKAVMGAAAA